MHQQRELLLDLSQQLSRSADELIVLSRRQLVDEAPREALNHPAVDTARPVVPLKMSRRHVVEWARVGLHVEHVVGRVDFDDLNEFVGPLRQVVSCKELLQLTAQNRRTGDRVRVLLTHCGHRSVQRVRGQRHASSLERKPDSECSRAARRRIGGPQDGQMVALTRLADSDRGFGGPEPREVEIDPAAEEGRFGRTVRIRGHHLKV